MIRKAVDADVEAILAIVNDGARAYRGVIPADRWHEPYMPKDELEREIAAGIVFWIAEEGGEALGVMGIQDKGEVALIRHAYVGTKLQRKGVGTKLLAHLQGLAENPFLIGTWAAASWAIDFYRRNGFAVVSEAEKNRLLRKYWTIPERQIETSVVLADARWIQRAARIEPLQSGDRVAWEVLARGYKEFYRTPTTDAEYDAAWQRLMAQEGVYGLAAHTEGKLVGIAHYLFHTSAWAQSVCYLQDLFTAREARGKGVGRALIEAVAAEARRRGAAKYYWLTQDNNATARTLYDKVAKHVGFIRYDYAMGPGKSLD